MDRVKIKELHVKGISAREKYVTSTFLMYAKKLYEGQLTNV